MSMDWWRAHHGISNDSKLCVIALKSKSRKCEVGWVWVIVLDYASQNENRGFITGLDDEQISVMADIPVEQVSAIIEQFKQRGLIQQDGMVTTWLKRQPLRERSDDSSTERVRRFRDKQRSETPCNATKHPDKIRLDEIREEHHQHSNGTNGAPPPMMPPISQSEYPLTIAEIRRHDPAVDDIFVLKLVQTATQACLSNPRFPQEKVAKATTDKVIAAACKESYASGPQQHRTGLLLSRVPPILITWGVEGAK